MVSFSSKLQAYYLKVSLQGNTRLYVCHKVNDNAMIRPVPSVTDKYQQKFILKVCFSNLNWMTLLSIGVRTSCPVVKYITEFICCQCFYRNVYQYCLICTHTH